MIHCYFGIFIANTWVGMKNVFVFSIYNERQKRQGAAQKLKIQNGHFKKKKKIDS